MLVVIRFPKLLWVMKIRGGLVFRRNNGQRVLGAEIAIKYLMVLLSLWLR